MFCIEVQVYSYLQAYRMVIFLLFVEYGKNIADRQVTGVSTPSHPSARACSRRIKQMKEAVNV